MHEEVKKHYYKYEMIDGYYICVSKLLFKAIYIIEINDGTEMKRASETKDIEEMERIYNYYVRLVITGLINPKKLPF